MNNLYAAVLRCPAIADLTAEIRRAVIYQNQLKILVWASILVIQLEIQCSARYTGTMIESIIILFYQIYLYYLKTCSLFFNSRTCFPI